MENLTSDEEAGTSDGAVATNEEEIFRRDANDCYASGNDRCFVHSEKTKNSIIGCNININCVGCGNQGSPITDIIPDELSRGLIGDTLSDVKNSSSGEENKEIDKNTLDRIPHLKNKYKTSQAFMRSFFWPIVEHDSSIDDYFVDLELDRYDRMGQKIFEKNIALEQIFGDNHTKTILVTGDPGFGKTALTKKLSYDWAKNQPYMSRFDVVIVLPLRELGHTSVNDGIRNILSDERSTQERSESKRTKDTLKHSKLNFLIILDGFDEVSNRFSVEEFIQETSRLEIVTLLLTSRPAAVKDLRTEFERNISVAGFSEDNQNRYVSLTSKRHDIKNVDALFSKLKNGPFLSQLAKCPLILHMFCVIHNHVDLCSLKKLTDVYVEIFDLFIRRYELKYKGNDLSFLKKGKCGFLGEDLLIKLGKLAYTYSKRKISITEVKLKEVFCETCEYNFITGLDILISTPIITLEEEVISFHPLHLSFFEFLSSLYVSNIEGSCIFKFGHVHFHFYSRDISMRYRSYLEFDLKSEKVDSITMNEFLFISGLMKSCDFVLAFSKTCTQANRIGDFECLYPYFDALLRDNFDLWKKCCSKLKTLKFRMDYFEERHDHFYDLLLTHSSVEKLTIYYDNLWYPHVNSECIQCDRKRWKRILSKYSSLREVVSRYSVSFKFYVIPTQNCVTYCVDIRFILNLFLDVFIKSPQHLNLQIWVRPLDPSEDRWLVEGVGLLTESLSDIRFKYKTELTSGRNERLIIHYDDCDGDFELIERPDRLLYIVSTEQFGILNEHFDLNENVKLLDETALKACMKCMKYE